MVRYACIENMRRPPDSVLGACLLACILACTDRQQAAGEEEIVIGVIAPVASTFLRSGDPMRSAVIMRLADDGTAHLHRKLDP